MQGKAWFHSSNHITFNYLDSMGSLWIWVFTRTRENARNKEYANLFMKAHGVSGPSLHFYLEFKFHIRIYSNGEMWVKDANQHDGWSRVVRASSGAADPGVRQYLLWSIRSYLGRVAWSWSIGVVQHVGGVISSEFSPCAFERSPPQLFLYLLLVLCNITNKIRKRTDTDVAFTQEYFKVSYPHGNVITLSMGSGYPRTHTKEEITSSLYFELLILTGVYKPIAPVIRALSNIRT